MVTVIKPVLLAEKVQLLAPPEHGAGFNKVALAQVGLPHVIKLVAVA